MEALEHLQASHGQMGLKAGHIPPAESADVTGVDTGGFRCDLPALQQYNVMPTQGQVVRRGGPGDSSPDNQYFRFCHIHSQRLA